MTDYTSLASVKLALGSSETADDDLLETLITQASRAIDRFCAGFVDSDDYFVSESVSAETGPGVVATDGTLHYWTRKPRVTGVSAISYRFSGGDDWIALEASDADLRGCRVSVWGVPGHRGNVQVQISYTGGFDPLPDDLTNIADLLTVRLYREIKSGLGDSIGVAELGTLQYTKALPARLVEMLKPYKRATPL